MQDQEPFGALLLRGHSSAYRDVWGLKPVIAKWPLCNRGLGYGYD